MLRIFKCLLLPVALVAVTQTSIVSAETIRLKGPDGEIQASPQYSDFVPQDLRNNEPSRFYGPTTSQETLWAIASRLRPSASVSVQQTLLAVYQLNPQAFENQNIHELIPGSTLRIPSLAQVQSVSTQEAVNVMAAHQARLTDIPAVSRPTPQTRPQQQPQEMKPSNAEKPMMDDTKPAMQPNADLAKIAKQEQKAQVSTLEKQLESSEGELMALEEKNHKLRLMLADVQSEVDVLKDELGDESRIRTEVEKLLEAERLRLAEEQKMKPSPLDELLSNTWLVAAAAIIPGLLIGLLIMMLLGRRKKEDSEAQTATEQTVQPVAPITPDSLNEEVDDDLLLDDDLFGESTDDEEELFSDDSGLDEVKEDGEVDVFADLEDNDLDFNLEGEDGEDPFAGIGDDGELDEALADLDASTNGISVNSEDKALGLEEMERALDEVIIEDESPEGEFDLSDDDDEISQDELDSLLASDGDSEDLGTDELDQSLLDDLFSETDSDDSSDDLDFDSLLDEAGDDFDLSGNDGSVEATDANEPNLASDSEIDDLFSQVEAQADLEKLEAEALDETALLDELVEEPTPTLDEGSTELLDELIDDDGTEDFSKDDELDDFLSDDLDLSSDSDTSFDELITEDSDELDADSTETLDEFLTDDHIDDIASLEDSTELLDDIFEAESQQEQPISEELGDEGTDLFEELLEIEKQSEEPVQEVPEEEIPLVEPEENQPKQGEEPETPASDDKFSSEDFIDDMLSAAPEGDPLLDELDLDEPDLSEAVSEEVVAAQPEDDSNFAEPEPEPEEDDWLTSAIDEVESPQLAEESEFDLVQDENQDALSSDMETLELDEPEAAGPESEQDDEDDWLTSAIDEVENPSSELEESHEVPVTSSAQLDESTAVAAEENVPVEEDLLAQQEQTDTSSEETPETP
ncbi:FimV/HubP family polar landmark protein, partial [Vibrio neptunius]|uniref:FimV/HubP family polar landmark protein n=1 Tax=Vibrio neptunius TaxID=170651 RepID=UPI0005F9FDAD